MYNIEKELNEIEFQKHELDDSTRLAVRLMAIGQAQKNAQPEKRVWLMRTVYSAAVVALAVFLIFAVIPDASPAGYYTIDINPSISIAVDQNDNVLEVSAENSDAHRLLEGTLLRDISFEQALEQIVNLAAAQGYFEQDAHLLVAHFGETPGISTEKVKQAVSQSTEHPVQVLVLQSTKTEYQNAKRQNKKAGVEMLKQKARDMHLDDDNEVGAIIDSMVDTQSDQSNAGRNADKNASQNANKNANENAGRNENASQNANKNANKKNDHADRNHPPDKDMNNPRNENAGKANPQGPDK